MAISLVKGQKISLAKASADAGASATLTKILMGLGWDVQKGFFGGSGGSIDLDASCIMFDDKGKQADAVWFSQLRSRDGSVQHSGDNRTGAGDGDDESITVDLSKVPANISTLIFTVNSFTGQTFAKVKNAYCRAVDVATGKELARLNLTEAGDHTGQIMAKVYRYNGEWKMAAIGEVSRGRTFQDMHKELTSHAEIAAAAG